MQCVRIVVFNIKGKFIKEIFAELTQDIFQANITLIPINVE